MKPPGGQVLRPSRTSSTTHALRSCQARATSCCGVTAWPLQAAPRLGIPHASSLTSMTSMGAVVFSALKIQINPPTPPTMKYTAPNRIETTVPSI